MRLTDAVRRQLDGMGAMERRQTVSELRQLVYELTYEPPADDELACPWCGSISYVRKGHDRNKAQRYQCRDCRRTFTAKRDTLIGRSKLPVGKWMLYVECFIDMLPLRECARRCRVSLRTAWLMRVRLITCMEQYLPAFQARAGESVELDETYVRESFTGNHKRGKFKLPRPARHRWKSLKKRGLSKEQICIMTGMADDGGAFATLCGRGVLSVDRALESLSHRISKGSHVVMDDALAYPKVLEALGAEHEATDAKQHRINRVNALHSSLKGFMSGFRGVSTKHLQTYLSHGSYGGALTQAVRRVAWCGSRTRSHAPAPHGIGTASHHPTWTIGAWRPRSMVADELQCAYTNRAQEVRSWVLRRRRCGSTRS